MAQLGEILAAYISTCRITLRIRRALSKVLSLLLARPVRRLGGTSGRMMNDRSRAQAVKQTVAFVAAVRHCPAAGRRQALCNYLDAIKATGLRDRATLVTLIDVAIESILVLASELDLAAIYGTWRVEVTRTRRSNSDVLEGAKRLFGAGQSGRRLSPTVLAARDYLQRHYQERVTCRHVADAVCRHHSYIAARFRRETGKTIQRFVSELRISRAAELVLEGEKVEWSMLSVGYHSKRSFYKHFRSMIGTTPGVYRSKIGFSD